MSIRSLAAALLLALAPFSPALAQPAAAPAVAAPEPVWAFEDSDLPLDTAYRFGTLDNGLRYIIRPNATPAGQGMVQLWIDAGSVSERDDERGYAHFIEHMALSLSASAFCSDSIVPIGRRWGNSAFGNRNSSWSIVLRSA